MRSRVTFFLLSFTVFASNAQLVCKDFYPDSTIENIKDTAGIAAYLKTFSGEKNHDCNLVLNAKTESPFSVHYSFYQTLNGIEIKDANIKINLSKNGRIISVFSNLPDTVPQETDAANDETKNILNAIAAKYFLDKSIKNSVVSTYVYVPNGDKLSLCLQLDFVEKNGISKEVLLGENGIIAEKITSAFFDTDSLVSGKIFNPDPLTTAQVLYGSPYIDSNNADIPVLNNQRQTKTFKANFDGSIFTLKNSFLQLLDLNGDGILPAVSDTPVFNFTRAQNGFEDVNAFYHISFHRNYVHAAGFTSADNFVRIDPHGTTDDNSFFTAPNSIYFGTGGVDDAEDADVLIHEYSHFVSYNSSPNSNSGFERMSLDEGIADYFAASYSKTLSNYNWFWVYNWDGHNEFWSGRIVNSTKHYPEDLSATSFYQNSMLWSSTLMEIYNDLGYRYTDSLVLSLLYFFAPNMTQPQAAQTLLHCDTLLSGGAHFCPIYKRCYERGYLPFTQNSCGISAINEPKIIPAKLLYTANGFALQSDENVQIFSYEILNLNGQICFASQGNLFGQKENLASGLYLVSVQTNRGKTALKWANF